MKKTIMAITALALCLLVSLPEAGAQQRATRDISVELTILDDGSVKVNEKRDVTEMQGTEQYIVRSTEGDLAITNLSVSDNHLGAFINIGEWNVDATFDQKAGKCGLVHKLNSVEICYGLGSYGDHLFNIEYTIEKAVKSLNDCDMLFLTVVADGINPLPEHVSAKISVPGTPLDTLNTRIWAFGYEGDIGFDEQTGQVIAESSAPFKSNSKMIVLMRFEKGILQPTSVIDKDFKHYQDMAFEGSDYGEPKDTKAWPGIVGFLAMLAGIIGLGKSSVAKKKRNMLGMKPDEVMWFRDVPANGDLIEANYIISQLGEQKGKKQKGSLAAAYILQMVVDGQLISQVNGKGRSEFRFNDSKLTYSMPERATELYKFMKEAAGNDQVLQDNEFKRWAMKNATKMEAWIDGIKRDGLWRLSTDGSISTKSGKYTADGQKKCREVYGMKKFLTDFTIVDQRDVPEAQLWKEYLVYGALYGVADKVCKDLQQIDPSLYETIVQGGSTSLVNACNLSNSFSNSMTGAVAAAAAARSGGSGGHSSFGGGGGSFGGGHGGGTR